MNYLKVYCNLIRKAEIRTPPEGYIEKHHIFPVSIYGKNNKIVLLTGREHYIAHALLEKAFIKRYGISHWKTYKMSAAHSLMKDGTRYYNSYLYECARKRWGKMHSQKLKGNIPWNKGKKTNQIPWNKGLKTGSFAKRTEEWKQKISESNRGKSLSEEHKRKISQTLKGRPLSDETKQKMSVTRKGRERTQKEIEQLNSARLKRKITGSRWWNDGQNEMRSVECPGDKWVLGRCKRVF